MSTNLNAEAEGFNTIEAQLLAETGSAVIPVARPKTKFASVPTRPTRDVKGLGRRFKDVSPEGLKQDFEDTAEWRKNVTIAVSQSVEQQFLDRKAISLYVRSQREGTRETKGAEQEAQEGFDEWVRDEVLYPKSRKLTPDELRYARLELATGLLKHCPAVASEFVWTLFTIEKLGILGEGDVRHYGVGYGLTPDYKRERKIGERIDDLAKRVVATEMKQRAELAASVAESPFPGGVLAFADGQAGEGRLLLPVTLKDEGRGFNFHGSLAIEVADYGVTIIGGVGHVANLASQAMNALVITNRNELDSPRLNISQDLRKELGEDKWDLMLTVYLTIKAGVRNAVRQTVRQAKQEEELAELTALTNLTTKEGLLDRKVGRVLVNYGSRPFIVEQDGKEPVKLFDLVVVYERTEDGGQLTPFKVPERLKKSLEAHPEVFGKLIAFGVGQAKAELTPDEKRAHFEARQAAQAAKNETVGKELTEVFMGAAGEDADGVDAPPAPAPNEKTEAPKGQKKTQRTPRPKASRTARGSKRE